MHRNDENSIEYLRSLSCKLDSSLYNSVLFVYHSKEDDFLTKAVHIMSETQKIKYMIAIRTYAISPEYLSMICRSINNIIPNKIMLNIVSGDLHEEETSIEDLVDISNLVDSQDKRIEYTDRWMSKFTHMNPGIDIVMGGHSSKTLDLANKYNAIPLSMVDKYLASKDQSSGNQMVAIGVIITETEEEAEDFHQKYLNIYEIPKYIYGTKENFKSKIKYLEKNGVTDVLLHGHPMDNNANRIHDTIREMMEEENGIK
jgi:alkanesulfonate monooxygenase SsuD/methylene tetrahydromethanopterin reductase-like flavin-dependent oxidoreductase (luciferase family)